MSTPPASLVAVPVLPMFREPDALSEQVSQGLLGMAAATLERRGEWARVRTPDTYEGWAPVSGLSASPSGWNGQLVEIADVWANLRARPEYRQAAVTRAPLGSRLPRVGEEEGWIALLLPDGRKLWTEAHRIRPPEPHPAAPTAICRTARRLLGVPYLWGGNSPDGLDCSGFVQLVMRLHGVSLLRDAHLQMTQGGPISQPASADLVFFGPTEHPERITHVGMMLDGRRFIHAKGSDRVRIDPLDQPPYPAIFRGARRLIRR